MKADQPTAHPDTRESIAYAELLRLAHDEGLKSISTSLVLQPSEEHGRLAIVKAVVETERGRFEGLGDADPGSVDDFLAPHLVRVAETRAKARALRDAVNCGVVSSEELDGVSLDRNSHPGSGAPASHSSRPAWIGTTTTRPRGNGSYRPRSNVNGSSEPMTEGQRIDYLIDGRSRRVARKIDGVVERQWLYQNDVSPVAELDADGDLLWRFVYGTRAHVPDLAMRGDTAYRVVSDHLGSVRALVRASDDAVRAWWNYDAWGSRCTTRKVVVLN